MKSGTVRENSARSARNSFTSAMASLSSSSSSSSSLATSPIQREVRVGEKVRDKRMRWTNTKERKGMQ